MEDEMEMGSYLVDSASCGGIVHASVKIIVKFQ
jgi:hypothetical protein